MPLSKHFRRIKLSDTYSYFILWRFAIDFSTLSLESGCGERKGPTSFQAGKGVNRKISEEPEAKPEEKPDDEHGEKPDDEHEAKHDDEPDEEASPELLTVRDGVTSQIFGGIFLYPPSNASEFCRI